MKKHVIASVICLGCILLLAGCFGKSDQAEPEPNLLVKDGLSMKVEKMTAEPNPTGIELGFYPTGDRHAMVFNDFGKRPTSRIEFRGWHRVETSKGQYDWTGVFENMQVAHRFGQTPIVAINISFSSEIKSSTTIPSFYYPRITNPETREAAKKFVYAYVQELLQRVGSVILSMDYEIVSNYKLENDYDGTRKKEWSEWYVEAAAVARQAAADLGKSELLKLIPIVNGNPFTKNSSYYGGAQNNQWLIDVLRVSDYLGLDFYEIGDSEGPELDLTDPKSILDGIKYMIDNYVIPTDTELILSENGFTTVTEQYPEITWRNRGRYAGTEEQQKEYYDNLFAELEKENQPDGIFQNKLRGALIWKYIDLIPTDPGKGEYESYFGIKRLNGTPKPAFDVLKDAFSRMENDPFHSPITVTNTEDVTEQVLNSSTSGGVDVRYTNGNDYEYLKVELSQSLKTLKIVTENPGYLLARINNQQWLARANMEETEFELTLDSEQTENETNFVELYFTGNVFPFEQKVKSISAE